MEASSWEDVSTHWTQHSLISKFWFHISVFHISLSINCISISPPLAEILKLYQISKDFKVQANILKTFLKTQKLGGLKYYLGEVSSD